MGTELSSSLKGKLKGEAVRTLTITDNLTARGKNGTCPYEKFYKKKPLEVIYLRRFGEVGILANRKKIKAKDDDRGTKCIFVGYADDHTPDTYRMFNPKTKKILLSRDIRWMDTFKLEDKADNRIKIIDYEDDDIEVGQRESQREPQTPANQRISTVVPERPTMRTSISHLPREV